MADGANNGGHCAFRAMGTDSESAVRLIARNYARPRLATSARRAVLLSYRPVRGFNVFVDGGFVSVWLVGRGLSSDARLSKELK